MSTEEKRDDVDAQHAAMSWRERARESWDWHRAELTPNGEKRQERRQAFDEKYERCTHGTHSNRQCDGSER